MICPNCGSSMDRGEFCPECEHGDGAYCHCQSCTEGQGEKYYDAYEDDVDYA